MKGAVVCCDALTTVSPTYAREIRYPFFGQGMESILRENEYKLRGILNGIDNELYDPSTDPHLAVNYEAGSAGEKRGNKRALAEETRVAYRVKTPMIGMVTRLVRHKGLDLVEG